MNKKKARKKIKKAKRKEAELKEANEKRKLRIFLISFSIVILTLFIILDYNRTQKLKTNSKDSIAKITDIKRNIRKGKTSWQSVAYIEYFVEGEKMETSRQLHSNAKIGNCYKMVYVIDSPSIIEIDYSKNVDCVNK